MTTETKSADSSEPRVNPSTHESDRSSENGRKRVLVVDDDPLIRIALRAVLENAGYIVTVARDGTHALLHLGMGAQKPSLIILDIAMPGLDGMDLMEALRALRVSCMPKVIVLSAYLSPENTARATELGVQTVLSKPLPPDQLLTAVRNCLETGGGARAGQNSI